MVLALIQVSDAESPVLPIKSESELRHYLAVTPPGASPLDRLSPPARQRFLHAPVFGENGIGLTSAEQEMRKLGLIP